MLPSSSDLTYFVEICETNNMSRAAERLGISQPSLSLAMKRLENCIGTDLLIRQKNGVSITAAGKQLLLHAKELLQLWDKTKARALASEQSVQGRVSIGCASVIASYLLTPVLPQLLQDYPKLELTIKNDISRKITEQVIQLSLDIGIVINPIKHPDLILKKLFRDQTTCWRRNKNVDSSTIICEPSLQQTQEILKKLKLQNHARRVVYVDNLETVAHLTAEGAGIGILPTRVAEFMYPDHLQTIAKNPTHPDEAYLIYRHENRHLLSVKTVIEQIIKAKADR